MGGINQRAYVRIPLRLTARLEGEHWLGRVGQIRDYCPGGIFLACEVTGSDPTVGELDAADSRVQATVRFQIDLGSGPVGHTVRARVVRSFEAGLGLAFVDADPATLGALQQLAERQIAETATRTGGNPSIGDPKREAIVRECSALCTVEFGAVIASFCRRAEQQLVLASREATSTLAQQQFFDALNTLEAHQPRVRERFVGLFEQHFSELGQPLAAVEKPSEPLESDSLSLVDKGEFEDFLVVSELSTKLEFSHDLILMSINQRLDNVSDSRILNETNPIGPVAVCHAFRSALHSLQLTDASNQVLYDAFADELAHGLGGIYRVVDGFLGEEGLPATSPYGIKIVPELRSRPSRDRTTSMAGRGQAAHFGQPLSDASVASSGTTGTSDPWGVVPAPLSSSGDAVERIDSAPPPEVDLSDLAAGPGLRQPDQPDGTTHLRGEQPPTDIRGSGNGDVTASSSQPLPLAYSRPADPHQVGSGVAFGAAQALMSIQRAQHAPVEGAGSGVAAHNQVYSSDELLHALSGLSGPGFGAGELTGANRFGSGETFKDVLFSALNAQPDGGIKRIADAAIDTIALVQSLFEAFAEEPYLDEAVKSRILWLEPAVQRAAIAEPSVLAQREHPIRKFVNSLALVDAALVSESGFSRLEEVVDPVVERVIRESEHDPNAFDVASDLIGSVLEGQNATHEANVARVVKMSEEQQSLLNARRAAPEAERARDDDASTGAQEWSVWLNRAKRLKIGNDVELNEGNGETRQLLTLAWIGEGHNPFVFVNRSGEKAASLSLPELAMNLRRGLAVVRDRPEFPLFDRAMYKVLHRMHRKIEHSATRDQLTGVANRRTFEAEVSDALKRSVQEPELEYLLGVASFDGFEGAEQRGGVPVRASVVRHAVAVLQSVLGPDVTMGMVDEAHYGFLLERKAGADLSPELNQACRAVEEQPYEDDSGSYLVRARIGAVLIGRDSEDERTAMERAREACDAATNDAGGIRIEVRDDESVARPGMMDWVTLINRTLSQDLMQLRCQLVKPIDDSGKPHYEILLGLRDQDDQAIPAADFIAALEYYEQMAALDRWVIRNTLKWMAVNRKAVRDVAGFTIKLTRRAIEDDTLMEYILEQLTSTAVPPGKLCFEITQADAEGNLEQTGRLLRTLREFGCRFSLSKFGNGNSGGEELRALPVDFLKIDGCFVRGLAGNPDDLAMVQSATHLAHASGIRIVAEFVEQPETLETLKALGVDLVQGLAVGAPFYLTDLGPPPGMENAREALPSVGSDGGSSEISSGATAWEEDLNAFLELDADTPDWRAVGEAGSNTQERGPDRTRKL